MANYRWRRVGTFGGTPSHTAHLVRRDVVVTRCGMDFGDVFGIGESWDPGKAKCRKCSMTPARSYRR